VTARKLYGIKEIADEIGQDRHTVKQWHKRGKMPTADEQLSMGPVWTARRIRPWIEQQRARKER
jgi:hypothetical protein